MTARSIGGSRRRRCVCGLACPGRSPFLWQAGSAAPSPTHAACGHTGESAEHDARHRRLLGRLDSAGAQLVGTSLPRGREPESQRAKGRGWLSGSQRPSWVAPRAPGLLGVPRERARRRHTSPPARLTPPAPRRCQAVIWVLFGVGMFLRLKFDWLLLVATALALSGANIIGYVRCKSGAHARARTCPAAVLRYGRRPAAGPPPRHPFMHAALRACRRCEGEDHQCGDQPIRRQLRHPGHAERCGQGLRLLARGAACGEVAGVRARCCEV